MQKISQVPFEKLYAHDPSDGVQPLLDIKFILSLELWNLDISHLKSLNSDEPLQHCCHLHGTLEHLQTEDKQITCNLEQPTPEVEQFIKTSLCGVAQQKHYYYIEEHALLSEESVRALSILIIKPFLVVCNDSDSDVVRKPETIYLFFI